jgi:hypothetical protein
MDYEEVDSMEDAVGEEEVRQRPAFEARGHQQTAPTQDIRGSESTVKNDCKTD